MNLLWQWLLWYAGVTATPATPLAPNFRILVPSDQYRVLVPPDEPEVIA